MTTINTGGQAFPFNNDGMSLRHMNRGNIMLNYKQLRTMRRNGSFDHIRSANESGIILAATITIGFISVLVGLCSLYNVREGTAL